MNYNDLTAEQLRGSKELQAEVFRLMLTELENLGKCRNVFHELEEVLFSE